MSKTQNVNVFLIGEVCNMRLEQMCWNTAKGWEVTQSQLKASDVVDLVLVFGNPDLIVVPTRFDELKERYPDAHIIGGSTAGNVLGTSISDDDIVTTAVSFEKSNAKLVMDDVEDSSKLQETAVQLMSKLWTPNLKHVLVLSDGLCFNGSELANGLNEYENIPVTGGLLGDNGRFKETYVIGDGPAKSKRIVLLGLYGDQLHVGHGCFSGWGEFGIDRIITKSVGNIVYEIDGQPALKLYKKYLGDFAAQLPASGLRFPLSIRGATNGDTLIRTLLNINEDDQSLIFAGDVPKGSITVLMKGNVDDLIDGAGKAADQARHPDGKPGLAIVISCVGRKLLMDQMTDEELEAIQNKLGEKTWMTGFYSYGELAPHSKDRCQCLLHNQTMTLTSIYEL